MTHPLKDDTAAKADAWQERHPGLIRAIHKENGGHGSAVNMGLANATGRYFKVVDSDDWLDEHAMAEIMVYLRRQALPHPTDLVIGNYVYEKVHEGARTVMHYRNVFPEGREFGWADVGHFGQSQYLLMHSVIYRTDLLRDIDLKLPEHCFYVDNIFVYVPLPHVKTIYYRDVDMYRYFIGREDQSVNENVMMGRIDQQLRVTREMIDAVRLPDDVPEKRLERYMENYLSMMMCICSIFLRMIDTDEAEDKRGALGVPQSAQSGRLPSHPAQHAQHGHEPAHLVRSPHRHHRLPYGSEDLQVQLACMRNGESVSGSCRPKRTEHPCRSNRPFGDSVRLANCAAQAVRLFVFWEDGTKLHGCGWRGGIKRTMSKWPELFLRAERMRMCAISSCERTRKILRRHVERGEVVRPARGMYARAAYWSGLSKPEKMLHVMRTAQSIHPDWVFCHESAAVAFGLPVSYERLGASCCDDPIEPQCEFEDRSVARCRRRRIRHCAGTPCDAAAEDRLRLHAHGGFRVGPWPLRISRYASVGAGQARSFPMLGASAAISKERHMPCGRCTTLMPVAKAVANPSRAPR